MAGATRNPRLQVKILRKASASAVQRIRAKTAGGRLYGVTLVLARIVWLATVALTVALYAAGVWVWIGRVLGPCPPRVCVRGQVPPAVQRAFAALHLSVSSHGWYDLGMNVLFAFGFAAVAALLFSRRSHDLLALFVSLALLLFGVGAFEGGFLAAGLPAVSPAWRLPLAIVGFLGELAFGIFVLIFPDGCFVPSWTGVAAPVLLTLWWLPNIFFPGSPLDFTTWPGLAYFAGWAVLLSTMGGAQVYRYRRVSTPRQRLQTKWVTYGFVAAGIGYFAGQLVVYFLAPTLTSPSAVLADLSGYTLAYSSILLIPISIGIAMLRSHLFDIDVLIRRTAVYSVLTATLALVYVSSVLGAQTIVQAVGGRQPLPPVVLVASTLLIVVLFQPLRQRVQNGIDRRFYRRKYDAARILADFGRTLETEVDLARLTDHLLAAAEETMQPTHLSLWLVRHVSPNEPDLESGHSLPSTVG